MGAGKSTALAILERLGAAVLSSDQVVHDLYAHDHGLREQIVGRWGQQMAPGGVTDRSLVAARVFADEGERKWLEGLLWPMVAARVAEWLAEVRLLDPPPCAAIVEVPLLFEAGMEKIYDATIAVVAGESLRRSRAAGRGHALADERETRQLPQQEKASRADFVIHNDGDMRELEEQARGVLEQLAPQPQAHQSGR